jgi:hypothetical protein
LPRTQPAPFAFTSDGTLLLNLTSELSLPELERLLRIPGVFVGVPLSAEEARGLLTRIGDAGAEAAAQILGARRKKKPRRNGRKR